MVNPEELVRRFCVRFGGAQAELHIRAPGRVNLIGEHVDYNDGPVMPMAIEPALHAIVGPGADERIVAYAAQTDELAAVHLTQNAAPTAQRGLARFVEAVTAELLASGTRPAPANIYLHGDLPVGAGLASSAALEVALAMALLHVSGSVLPPAELARLCRRAEHRCTGVPCGIMDQLACVMGRAGHALLIDCRTGDVRPVPWPGDRVTALVIDSGCRRRLSAGEYGRRVDECRRAVVALGQLHAELSSLRDVSPEELRSAPGLIPALLYRRARHVVTEIERSRQFAAALEAGDVATAGRLMDESHASLRDDYDVSSPQLDDLAATVRSVPGVFGARLTGAGFGGCIVALAGPDGPAAFRAVESALRRQYDTKYRVTARVSLVSPCDGATATRLQRTAGPLERR